MGKGDLQQVVQHQLPAQHDGSVEAFAGEFPGVMVALVVLLLGICGWLLRERMSQGWDRIKGGKSK